MKRIRMVMKYCWNIALLVIMVCVKALAQTAHKDVRIVDMYCDLMANADYQSADGYVLVSDKDAVIQGNQYATVLNSKPAFSWSIAAYGGNFRQTAYQILVADNAEQLNQSIGNIWDSGKVKSSQSAGIRFGGENLSPNKTFFWKIKIWCEDKDEPIDGRMATFRTGDLAEGYQTSRYPLQRSDETPTRLQSLSENNYLLDFDKAAFGQLRLTLHSDLHDTVTVHLGEKLNAAGRVDAKPGGTIRYQKHELAIRPGRHTYELQFPKDKRNTGPTAILMPAYIGEVLPFRYVELEGYQGELAKENLVRSAVHYPFNDEAAHFSSSNDTLNQIWELCKYSVKATTFAGVYVDGDRERIPYEADAYINQLCHYAVDNEYTLARYSHEYLIRHATWPTEWILQSVLMAYNDYLYTGDLRSAAHYYDDLKAKTLTSLEESNGLISTRTGKQNRELMQAIHFNGDSIRDIVDWPHSGILGLGDQDAGETDGFVFTDFNAVVNAYYYKALVEMGELAEALGKTDDSRAYRERAEKVYQAFQKFFFNKSGKYFTDGIGTDHASLHTNMFALAFNLVPEKYRQSVMDFVQSRGLACSVYGSQFLMDAIYMGENGDYGLSLLTSTAERSWYNMIREGSTITMEAWGNKFKPNQDWNHVWGAVPANIIPRKLMGIEPTSPAWETFRIKPQIGNLSSAKIKVPTIKGAVVANYEQHKQFFKMHVEIPANTQADIYVPTGRTKGKVTLLVNEQKQQVNSHAGWAKLIHIGSGKYDIELRH
ncbi:family 78 glycoside hydrolase catalytic domain [Olivibacter sp. SDN3]|uniref:family 78 glycoside hydrolase catalytic domain n=1 Tax=Olivibacter sp. SDN3 TaxID=2764720 RepID=UPI001650F925|nr:family 78 glycoside hydrolase catalytic domain [Olivibacter sp. SDN3]QNL50465.1 family 78 glycoside hydrolase catalytic domain [Olivibacter sp. SDN3]